MASISAGGLISAVTASAPTQHSAWAVAYLVLVVGLAQGALGLGQAWLADDAPLRRLVITECITFNLGNTGVLLGTLFSLPVLVDAGGVALVIALTFFLRGVRGAWTGNWLRVLYRISVAILLVSIPVGLVLAHLRAG